MQFIDICSHIAHTLLPQACLLCGAGSGPELLCPGCMEELPHQPATACPVCAIPHASAAVCGSCLDHAPHFDATLAAFDYRYPVDALLRALKYQGRLEIAALVGRRLAEQVRHHRLERLRPMPDLVLPMPLHAQRLLERGFNQAAEIGRVVAQALALPFCAEAALRIRATPSQASLPLARRSSNLRRAFAGAQEFTGLHVAIVDDVMTSGASLDELAGTLKAAGARQVECWVAARTRLE